MTPSTATTVLVMKVLDALRAKTGLDAVIVTGAAPTADVVIEIRKGPRAWRFTVETKAWLNQATIGLMKQRTITPPNDRILITRVVTTAQADELREKGLAFLDAAGNAYLDQDGLYVFIKGQKLPDEKVHQRVGFYRPADLRVLFGFLCQEGLEARPHEEIARATGAGAGTVNRVIQALIREGYILKLKGRTRRLVRKKALLEQWVTAYPHTLRPKLQLARFAGLRPDWWMTVDPKGFEALWGGEVAGKILTRYLKPQVVTLYGAGDMHALMIQQRLRKDVNGDVEILKRFWNFPSPAGTPDTVPPLLVYADLIATGIDRNIETAGMVYEQYLAGLVREG